MLIATLAHQAAIVEHVLGRRPPVANVEREQVATIAAPFDLPLEVGVPPEVIDINHHADVGEPQFVAHVVRLAQRVDRTATVGVHRVERFDSQLHAGLLGMIGHGRDPVADLLPTLRERHTRDRAADEDQDRSAQPLAFVNGTPVVVDGRLASRLIRRRKKKPPLATLTISSPASFAILPQTTGSRPSSHCRQTVIPFTPAAAYFSIASSIDQGVVVIVWMHRREKSVNGSAGIFDSFDSNTT